MSRGNVEDLVHRVADAVNRRDAEALGAMFHPEFEYHSAIAAAEGTYYRGVDGMRQYFDDVDSTWKDFRIEVEDIREVGEQVLVLWRVTATSRAGVPLDQITGQVWTWRDGMPWRNTAFTDPREALEAVGLPE